MMSPTKRLTGRTRLMKLVYLAQVEAPSAVEALTGSRAPYEFGRHLYGPFSVDLLHDLDSLAARGFATQKSKSLDHEGKIVQLEYQTTPIGAERVASLMAKPHVRDLQAMVARFASLPTQALLRYVYTRYLRDSDVKPEEKAQPA